MSFTRVSVKCYTWGTEIVCRLGADLLGRRSAKKDLGVLMENS